MLVVNRLQHFVHLIPLKKTDTVDEIAQLFIAHVVGITGIPNDIVSDRDSRWTSRFWKALMSRLSVELHMTTARHQQANGLAEATVKSVKNLLRHVLTYGETDWTRILPMIQLAYNQTVNTATGFTPFEMTFGQRGGRMPSIDAQESDIPAVDELTSQLQDIIDRARKHITEAQARQQKNYDTGRRDQTFKQHDDVLLSREGIQLPTNSTYMLPFVGPFKVAECLPNDNYRLQLPPTMRIHPVFHVSKLRRYRQDDTLQRPQRRPPPETVDGEDEYEVDHIVRHRIRHRKKQYLIHWRGYAHSDNSWEPATEIRRHAAEIVHEYERHIGAQVMSIMSINTMVMEPIEVATTDEPVTTSRTLRRQAALMAAGYECSEGRGQLHADVLMLQVPKQMVVEKGKNRPPTGVQVPTAAPTSGDAAPAAAATLGAAAPPPAAAPGAAAPVPAPVSAVAASALAACAAAGPFALYARSDGPSWPMNRASPGKNTKCRAFWSSGIFSRRGCPPTTL